MNDFAFYFDLGWKHIISTDALDHQLFILALTAIYLAENWKQVLVLVTAFTIGHSITLALSVYDFVRVNSDWVEFLIPLTIVLTALINFTRKDCHNKSLYINYFLAAGFGLIHGLGFANTIRFMLAKSQSIAWPLFGFNVGLEAGQICLVLVLMLLGYLLVNIAGWQRRWWTWGLSGFAIVISSAICIQRWPI